MSHDDKSRAYMYRIVRFGKHNLQEQCCTNYGYSTSGFF